MRHWLSTFGRTKDPPMSLKAGKDVWLVDLRTPFLSLSQNLCVKFVERDCSKITYKLPSSSGEAGIARGLGPRGRGFESCLLDQIGRANSNYNNIFSGK